MPTTHNRSDLAKLIRRCAAPNMPAVLEVDANLLTHSQVELAFERAGWFAAVVDRAPVFSKDTLLHALYQSCKLPAYFGFNWDALADALSDLSTPAKGFVLVLKSPELLRERAPDVLATFLDVIEAVNERYAGEGKPFKVLLGQTEP